MSRSTAIEPGRYVRATLVAGVLVVMAAAPIEAKAQDTGRVFALLAIDTDAKIAGLEDDERGMTAALESGFGSTGLLQLRVLEADKLSPNAIVSAIRGLPIGPDDTLLVYYTGHGATVEGRGHVLTMAHGNLLRSDLRAIMAKKRARLSVLLTDCCSSLVKPRKEPPVMGAPAPVAKVSPMLRCLLLQHSGVVDLTSSSYGEASWSRPGTGGLFTAALTTAMGSGGIEEFDTDKDGFVTWTEVFEWVRHETQASFENFKKDLLELDARGIDPGLRDKLKSQRGQVPQAFALGEALRTAARREFFAPNIGIHFEMVRVGGAAGARLTKEPIRGSGATQLGLERGDTIYNLDGLPIREAVDVMNHHARTDVRFINVRNGKQQLGVMRLPPHTPLPPDVPPERYAANLGVHYQLMPYEGDTFGVRLSRTANRNKPAGAIGLERGDMIIRLDDQPIRDPQDVLNHIDRTKVELIDIQTGKIATRVVQLPGRVVR
jgi:hypothetical protein